MVEETAAEVSTVEAGGEVEVAWFGLAVSAPSLDLAANLDGAHVGGLRGRPVVPQDSDAESAQSV